MSTDDRARDEVVARLKLDVKALTLLYESDADLQPVLERSLVESQEDYVRRFIGLVQSKSPPQKGGGVPVAVGEIVLASFLTIVGLAAFVPVLAGVATPQQLGSYLSGLGSATGGPLSYGIPLLDFLFSALLLLGAFYTLRRASKNLKDAGMVVEPGRR
ncbi:MAG TPA: hypothetical protein VLX56_00445 [Nitrososphaerales archaeon]|nr:hypothetical protein [Nitrososphaerales archaeon]